MTINEYMLLLSIVAPFACGVKFGWKMGGGFGVLLGLIFGLVLGAGCAWGTRRMFRWVAHHPKLGVRKPDPIWTVVVWLLFAILLIWIGGCAYAAISLTGFAIHHSVA